MSRQLLPSNYLHQRGLTLIELLVSLVILGFVVTVMSGAFYQVAQVVRVADEANGKFQPQWLKQRALTDLIANLITPPNEERPFTGNSSQFSGYSLLMPQGNWGAQQAFNVKLTRTDSGGMSLSITPEAGQEILLTSWDFPVQFEYVAADGARQLVWPPFGKNVDLLPAGIIVRATAGEQVVQLVAPYAGSRQAPPDPLKDLAKLFGTAIK